MLSAKMVAQKPAGSLSCAAVSAQAAVAGAVAAAPAAPTVSGRFAAEPSSFLAQAERASAARSAAIVRRGVRSYTYSILWNENGRERQEAGRNRPRADARRRD